MDVTFDTGTGALAIDAALVQPWGADLRAKVERHGHAISLRGVEMRLTVAADGETVADLHLPPPGVRFARTDQDVIAAGRVAWAPDQHIDVAAWCRDATGQEHTAEAAFTVPRPPQPYPSWVWQDGRWTAPEPMPEDGPWAWDEDAGEWVPAPEDGSP